MADITGIVEQVTIDGIVFGGGVGKVYVDQQDALRVLKTGDTMTGLLGSPGIVFAPIDPYVHSAGYLAYDLAEETLSYSLADGGILQIGKEFFDYFTNLSGDDLVDGDIVSIVGVSGGRQAVDLTDATDNQSSSACIGMITSGNTQNEKVRVTLIGAVHKLDTDGLTEGLPVYVDPANPGKYVQAVPQAPNNFIHIGIVEVAHAVNGIIIIGVRVSPLLVNLGDVNGTPLTVSGQFPLWDQTAGYFDFADNINNYLPLTGGVLSGGLRINGGYTIAGGLSLGDGDSGFYETSDDVMEIKAGGTGSGVRFSNIGGVTGISFGADTNTRVRYSGGNLEFTAQAIATSRVTFRSLSGAKFTDGLNVPYVQFNTDNSRVGIAGSAATNTLSTLHLDGGVGSLATGLSFGDGDTGIYELLDDQLIIRSGGVDAMNIKPLQSIVNNDINVIGEILQSGLHVREVTELYNSDSASTVVVASGASVILTFDTKGEDTGGNTLTFTDVTIGNQGIYKVDGSFSFSSSIPNPVVKVAAYKNGILLPNIRFRRKISASGDVGSGSLTGFTSCVATDVIDIRIEHDLGVSITFSMVDMNFNLNKSHR